MINAMQAHNVIISTSSACHSKDTKVSHVVSAMNVPHEYARGVVRISFGMFNTDEEIQQVKDIIERVIQQVKGEVKKI